MQRWSSMLIRIFLGGLGDKMAMEPTRYEINQNVKYVLVRHAVDLTRVEFSCLGTTVSLNGELNKDPSGEYTPAEVEALVKEISDLPGVRDLQVELYDWNCSSDLGSWTISKKKKTSGASPASSKTLIIEKEEFIKDVLQDLKEKNEL
jgi:hypothetical protein